ncbi:MAG: phenylalanine--tRNA ligase subunit beta [Burkholderiaceae bacterium]
MQLPESWLREFCDPPISTAALCDLLTMGGMEVEEARLVAPPFSGVVVGHVLEVARHPNADRLSVCQVDVGRGVPLGIVCGAPNVRAGIKVPCALVGAALPSADEGNSKPFVIRLGQLRGVESQGMLCSARELRLSDDHGGLLILDESAEIGRDVREALRLDDTLITLKLTPNLGHCLSVYGIARELSALSGAPLSTPSFPTVAVNGDPRLPVVIEAADLCGRFSGRVVTNVDPTTPTPAWMVDRLTRCGQRSVSALVDISNYVMFEYGRPSHIFDFDKIHGGLAVRWERDGETLELLNGSTVALDPTVGVIADDHAVESLAGIMGGAATAVSDATRNIYVEAAFWWPEAVAGRSRRFNFTTDAGHRFERGVDPATTVEHIERITALIVSICGGATTRCGPIDDQAAGLPDPAPVTLRVERAAKVIGMPVTQAQCEDTMRRLGLPFRSEPGRLHVTPPSWRFDLRIEEDLIEEVIRLLGYGALPDASPRGDLTPRVASESQRDADGLRERAVGLGYRETINFSFVEERWERDLAGNAEPIRVLNPIASSLSVMRSSLIGSLVGVLRFNLARRATRVQVFEAGRVFLRDPAAPDGPREVRGVRQPLRIAGLVYGAAAPLQWGQAERAVDFYDVKGDVEALCAPRRPVFVASPHPALHPGRSARVEIDGVVVGHVGELHPRWRQAYELPVAPMLFELDQAALARVALPAFAALPRLQSAWRDIAVLASEEVTHAALMAAIEAVPGGLVRSAQLFDVYRPAKVTAAGSASERSLAVRLEIRDDDATLTDERIDAVVADVLGALQRRLGLRLRT